MWIADAAALISRQAPDWDRAMAAARDVGLERILPLGLRLASDVLGAELPPRLKASVLSDSVVLRLAAQIKSRLASRELREVGILQRAAFRMRMCGGLLAGTAYLLRLSLLPLKKIGLQEKKGIVRPSWTPSADRSALQENTAAAPRIERREKKVRAPTPGP